MFFNIYLEDILRARFEARGDRPLVEHSDSVKREDENIPDEEIYADDTESISLCEDEKPKMLTDAEKIFPTRNLKIKQNTPLLKEETEI